MVLEARPCRGRLVGGSVIIQKTVVEGSKTIKQSTHDGLTTWSTQTLLETYPVLRLLFILLLEYLYYTYSDFLKLFLKKTILRSGEWERGKFDFDHHFAFLTVFLKRWNFLLGSICFGSSRGSFSKKTVVQNGPSVQIL